MRAELIETLWNVNTVDEWDKYELHHRINRNIVECKFTQFAPMWDEDTELIETLWNVNNFIISLYLYMRLN